MITLYNLYRLQEEYHLTDDTTQTGEEEEAEGALTGLEECLHNWSGHT